MAEEVAPEKEEEGEEDKELRTKIAAIVSAADLENLTIRKVCHAVTVRFTE